MRTSDVVLVGFTTSPRDDAETYMPAFAPNSNVKNEEVAKRQVAEKRGRFLIDLASRPYLGSLETVYIALASDLDKSKSATFNFDTEGHLVGPSISNLLYQWFPDHFDADTGHYNEGYDPIRFIGFNVRNFVKMLGLECAEYGDSILPHALWFNTDHRDMREAVLPQPECAGMTLDVVIDRLGIQMPEKMSYEPGDDAHLDAMIAAECAAKTNIFPFATKALTRIARSLRTSMGMDTPADNKTRTDKAVKSKVSSKPVAKSKKKAAKARG